MARTAWTLTDSSTGSPVTLDFTINPKDADYPGRKANISQELGTSPSAGKIVFQGRDALPRFSITGSVRTQNWFDSLETWANKWYPLVLTDDLGMTWNVIIESFQPKRIRKASTPWLFEVSITFLVV